MVHIPVTCEQVLAARVEVAACSTAGLEIDPLVQRMADVRLPDDEPDEDRDDLGPVTR